MDKDTGITPAIGLLIPTQMNIQLANVKGNVSAGMPTGPSPAAVAAFNTVVNTHARVAYKKLPIEGTKNMPPIATAVNDGLYPYKPSVSGFSGVPMAMLKRQPNAEPNAARVAVIGDDSAKPSKIIAPDTALPTKYTCATPASIPVNTLSTA